MRPAGVRVAKAQRAEHLVINHHRDHECGRWSKLSLQQCGGTAARMVVVAVDARTEHRLARSHDEGRGAGEVVAADRPRADHAAHVAGELPRAVSGGDAAERPRCGDVDEIEVSETRDGSPRGELGASLCRRRRLS